MSADKKDDAPEPAAVPSFGQKQNSTPGAAPRRFVIIGLPRSGTTYLMTLLNSHRDIHCSGELYNPHAIIGISESDDGFAAVSRRDRTPLIFMEEFFAAHCGTGISHLGFKFMIGHDLRVLRALAEDPEIALIYVHRNNRLAQASSWLKALETRRWAQAQADEHVARQINVSPRKICQHWREFETSDFLFSHWFEQVKNPKLTLEYRDLFAPDFNQKIVSFLGAEVDPDMKSPLVKQGSNTILDRFENPVLIERYFKAIGYDFWLKAEL